MCMKSELQGPSWTVLLLRVPPGRSLELWWQVEVVVGGVSLSLIPHFHVLPGPRFLCQSQCPSR